MSVTSYVSNASSLRSRADKDTISLRSKEDKDTASLRSRGEKDKDSSKSSPGASERQVENSHTKKLINAPETCVEDMLSGIATAYPGLGIDTASKIILRLEPEESSCVGIISGGGSGHEPFAAGFVGSGMLAAAVAGNVFTSPPTNNCVTAIMNVADHYRGGVLCLVLNYTGDVLNFGQAIEEVKDRNVQAEGFVFGEDCALVGENRFVGKRGLCGMLFIIKIAGGLSLMHYKLLQIIDVLRQVQSQMATLGVCTWPSSVPGATKPLFVIKENDLEIGVGIHGEAGVGKILVRTASEVVEIMLRKIYGAISLKSGDEVCVMINNLGGSSQMEIFIMLNEVTKQLEKRGITVARVYAGTFMTSLEMGGIQVTLLRISGHSDWLKLLDLKTDAIAWPACVLSNKNMTAVTTVKRTFFENRLFGPELAINHARVFKKCIEEVARQLISAESKLNQLDSGCGDGDCGSSFKRFAEGALVVIDSLPVKRPASCLMQLASIASNVMGGTSGGFYSLMLRGAARAAPDWVLAWESALDTVRTYTPAKVGYRTMMDALIPAFEKFTTQMEQFGNWEVALRSAVREADAGCERTKTMKALLGRASYVSEKYLTDVDAGAYAVTVWLKAIQKVLMANLKTV